MKKILFYLPLFCLLVLSCKPKQNMIYIKNNEQIKDEINRAKYEALTIQEGDELSILVSSLDANAVKPFNLNTVNSVVNERQSTSTQYSVPSQYIVDAEGYIHFPVLGKIYCKGMTQEMVKNELESRLKTYLKEPLVTITLSNFSISVLGEVENPGQKTSLTQKLNIFQALSLAGDMTDFGDRTNVRLIRTNEEGKEIVYNLDLSRRDIVRSPYYYLKQNDILYVQPDKNKQIQANYNPNRGLAFQLLSAGLSVVSFILAITR